MLIPFFLTAVHLEQFIRPQEPVRRIDKAGSMLLLIKTKYNDKGKKGSWYRYQQKVL